MSCSKGILKVVRDNTGIQEYLSEGLHYKVGLIVNSENEEIETVYILFCGFSKFRTLIKTIKKEVIILSNAWQVIGFLGPFERGFLKNA